MNSASIESQMRVGLVGAGTIARNGHLPALKLIPSLEVVGIADARSERAKSVAKKFRIPKYYGDFRSLIEDRKIDLVDVCTPPQVRLEVIKLAAEHGTHILVEKPLALSLREAMEIYRVIKRNGVKLNVVKNYRYFSSVIKARERVLKGHLGGIISIQGSALTPHPANQTRSTWLYHYGGALYDFAPHLIDMILWLNPSPVKRIFAFGGDFTGGNMGFINYSQILLEFENKAVAVADVSWLTAILGMRFTINIHGTGGHILLDVRNDSLIEFHGMLTTFEEISNIARKTGRLVKGVITGSYFKGATLFYKPLIEDFITSIKEGKEPPVPVEQGVIINAVLEAAKESIRQSKPIYMEELFESTKDFRDISKPLYNP